MIGNLIYFLGLIIVYPVLYVLFRGINDKNVLKIIYVFLFSTLILSGIILLMNSFLCPLGVTADNLGVYLSETIVFFIVNIILSGRKLFKIQSSSDKDFDYDGEGENSRAEEFFLSCIGYDTFMLVLSFIALFFHCILY